MFVTWDGGGNVPPAIGIATELQRRGDTIRFLGQEQQRGAIEGAGLRFEAYSTRRGDGHRLPRGPEPWECSPRCPPLRDLDPDGRKDLPPAIRFTGPVWQGEPRPRTPGSGNRTVLVSLSTVWFPRQVKVLQHILDALRGQDLHAVVTTGPVDPAQLRAPTNVTLHRYVPHAEVMPTVSLVIGHGGHATTTTALAHDLPLIILPMHRVTDQPIIGHAVQTAGAGRIPAKMTSPERIRRTVNEMLADGRHRQAAARLGARIRQHDGAAVAADALAEALARPWNLGGDDNAPGRSDLRR